MVMVVTFRRSGGGIIKPDRVDPMIVDASPCKCTNRQINPFGKIVVA